MMINGIRMKGIINICRVITFAVILSSCNFGNRNTPNRIYSEAKSIFPDSLLKGFPKELTSNYSNIQISYPVILEHNVNYCGFYFHTKPNKDFFDRQVDSLKMISIYQGFSSDSVIFPIPVKNAAIEISYSPEYHKYFIPKLNDRFSYFEKRNLVNPEILILDCGTENVIDLIKEDRPNDFPDKIKTGYSKGVFIDQKNQKIYFWFIVW